MSSILNSISSGNLLVQETPRDKPLKEDSIIGLLQNSEIELKTCPKLEEKEFSFDTGFGENNDLHYETKCNHDLKTPLYLENYLQEFKTEEEKAEARHALGLYNKGDVVAMSLLTAKEELPSLLEWKDALIKQMRLGDKFFTPLTTFKAVFNDDGISLDFYTNLLQRLIVNQQKEISKINTPSSNLEISSLGDVKIFLQGFNNGDNLHKTLDIMNQEMLRFEKTGLIE